MVGTCERCGEEFTHNGKKSAAPVLPGVRAACDAV
jgi:hypothetical protein